jgi:hypothetical protein
MESSGNDNHRVSTWGFFLRLSIILSLSFITLLNLVFALLLIIAANIPIRIDVLIMMVNSFS